MPYTLITLAQLTAALLNRLQDNAGVFTTTAEAQIYITEALRALNANTGIWNVDYQFDFLPGDAWKSLNVSGSPRERTVTDADIITQMEYMLLEPPSGLVWTGTSQFTLANFSNALQYRRDELLLASAANIVNVFEFSPTSGVRTILSDSTLDLRRVRWVPDSTVSGGIQPYALWREDVTSVNAYGDLLPIILGPPESWMITANSPLAFDVSQTPFIPGQFDMLAVWAGVPLAPPTASPLNLPNDWCHVAMYGALGDCLSNSPEAVDQLRAKYCYQRYEKGKQAMMKIPWLLQANVAKLPVDTPSYVEMDAYAQNWENNWPPSDPQIVVGGIDFVALAPFNVSAFIVSSVLTVIGNAPIPTAPTDFIQLSQDGVDAVLGYAQHLAMFKCGGADFVETIPLFQQFDEYCALQNHHYAALGRFRFETLGQGNRSEDIDPRFGPKERENGS